MFLTENRLCSAVGWGRWKLFPLYCKQTAEYLYSKGVQPATELYFQIALNHFLMVSLTGFTFCRLLHVWSFLLRLLCLPSLPSELFFTATSQVRWGKKSLNGTRPCFWVFQQRKLEVLSCTPSILTFWQAPFKSSHGEWFLWARVGGNVQSALGGRGWKQHDNCFV